MNNREKLLNFILSLTDEETKRIAAFLKSNQNKPVCCGKETSERRATKHQNADS